MQDTKRCARCGETKPRGEFPPGKKWRDGLFPYCRGCTRLAAAESYHRNRERRSAEFRERYRADPARWKNAAKRRYATKRDEVRAYQARWNAANRELERARRKKWRDANPEKVRLASARRRALRSNAPMLPFTAEQLSQRLAMFDGCWVCHGEANAIDHVKPLSKGGWHALCNLRPICTACNTRKKDRWPIPT